MPSPIHRDPDSDGDDYGCFTAAANRKVAAIVAAADRLIRAGGLTTQEEIIDVLRTRLSNIGDGATDMVVKENVRNALRPAIEEAGIEFDPMAFYGW